MAVLTRSEAKISVPLGPGGSSARTVRRGGGYDAERRQAFAGYLFIAPAMLIFFVFTLLPVAYALYLSFTNYDVFTKMDWIGTSNYEDVFQDELERAYEQDDLERTVRLNHEFHRTINVAADSPKLTQFMSGITRYAPESVFPTVSGWPKLSIRDHRRVIAAFERRDANRARMAMAEHFTVGVAPLTDHLIERGVISDVDAPAQSEAAGGS